jgi:Uma2 family endonuclease
LLEPRGCEAFELGAKTATVKNKKFRYPDVVVICQPELDERFIQNPCICVEVLSDSTEKTDKNDKLWEYCNLLSMLHYLIVSSDEPKIELYTRNTEGWQVTFIEGMNSSVFLKHFELQLPLKEVYKNVRFGEPKSDI